MPVNGATMRAALASVGAVGKQIASMDELASGADNALRQAPRGLTAAGAACFLATCAQESAYFRTTTEYGKGKLRYDPYRGRTFTQVTWLQNYRDFGRWAKARGFISDPEHFVKNPAALGEYRWAWLGPIQYWEENDIWRWANPGRFREVSQAINGGNGRVGSSFTPHGWKERQAMFAAFSRAGTTLLPTATAAPASTPPAAPPKPKALPDMIDRPIYPAPHAQTGRIVCPVGASSATVGRAWFSASFDGGARVEAWFQKAAAGSDAAAPGSGKPIDWTLRNAERPWVEVPSGTEFIQYRVTNAEGAGALSVELAPK